jgi:hypothetical protein
MKGTKMDNQQYLPVCIANIPKELKELKQWIYWVDKQPKNPYTHGGARAGDSSTWGTFEVCSQLIDKGYGQGLGFQFATDGGYVGIDLDHCRDSDTGVIEPWAHEIIDRVNSYTEVSPSGSGIHILARGTLPAGRRRKGNVEMYDRERYFTMTGVRLEDLPSDPMDRQDAINAVHADRLGTEDVAVKTVEVGALIVDTEANPPHDKWAALIDNNLAFKRLWNGTGKKYPSPSEADMAIGAFCGQAGFTAQELLDTMVTFRRRNGSQIPTHIGKYEGAICKGLAAALGEDADRGVSQEKDEAGTVQDLAELWGFPIDRWYAIRDAKGAYHLVSGSTHIECGDVGDVRNYATFSNKVGLYLQKSIPYHTARKWTDGPAKILIENVEMIDNPDGTLDSRLIDMVRSYFYQIGHFVRSEHSWEHDKPSHIFVWKGLTYVAVNDFYTWLTQTNNLHTNYIGGGLSRGDSLVQGLTSRLKNLGFTSRLVSYSVRGKKENKTNFTAYAFPPGLVSTLGLAGIVDDEDPQ